MTSFSVKAALSHLLSFAGLQTWAVQLEVRAKECIKDSALAFIPGPRMATEFKLLLIS
jgi:hypothetical protein